MYGWITNETNGLGSTRQEKVFIASGTEPGKSVDITVRIGVPLWATKEDAIVELLRWLNDDPDDAVSYTRVLDEHGQELPEASGDDEDEDEEED